ncbi:contractile injection system protein, VgrG/Pvc8 family [Methylobacter tundripaludum]|uniref:Late control D family protein n=1 Tax=Methylobacter tundripaludum (strain ATCC BAA-1195 / DSM 17260 / SV96) TaxID=697282 RepID=G3IRG5_METTV|nr:contractile injection system protein, VgrG/Pvc8 family [Methylobacter tundripaludum]EGW22176.1 late control D family protein [Methylobacter tundripaludum SV96]
MKPIFKVLADGADITARINQRLISIKTTDEAGFKSDTCTIDLDDRDGLIALPRKGAKLDIYLGYEEAGISKVGVYTVDEISLTGFPETLSISGKAADMQGELKSQKTRHFDNITLGDLVKTLAGDNGLVGKASADLAVIQLGHVDQTQESDLHLLTRLAKQYGGVAKVTNDHLILAKAGESKSVGGASLLPIYIDKTQVLPGYHCSITDRGKYASVTATYHDKATGQNIAVSTSTEKPAYTLRHTYDNQQQAIEAAQAKKSALDQGTATVDLSLSVGNADLFAESPLILTGFRSGITGPSWTATRVEHSFSKAGFTTQINGEIK